MNDLISREAAIKAIRKDIMGGLNYESILKELPSAQPERKKGEWIRTYRNGFGNLIGHCNQCGRSASVDNYCPNCGAQMERGIECQS